MRSWRLLLIEPIHHREVGTIHHQACCLEAEPDVPLVRTGFVCNAEVDGPPPHAAYAQVSSGEQRRTWCLRLKLRRKPFRVSLAFAAVCL
jgi:hypothetical protein